MIVNNFEIVKRFFRKAYVDDVSGAIRIDLYHRTFLFYEKWHKDRPELVLLSELVYYPQSTSGPSHIDEVDLKVGGIAECIDKIKDETCS